MLGPRSLAPGAWPAHAGAPWMPNPRGSRRFRRPWRWPTRDQIHGLKHFKRLAPLFARLHDVGCARDRAGNRELHFDGYCALVTLYLISPLIGSMRSLQHVLTLPGVAAKLG